jgi:hypothetical protein
MTTPEERQRTVERLTDRLLRAQRRMKPEQASDIAMRAGSDDQVLEVAATWMESGAWPSEPELEGWTPADLARLYRPSFVLTALLWLRRDPEAARKALKHSFADPEVDYRPQVTDDPIAAGFFARRRKEEDGGA